MPVFFLDEVIESGERLPDKEAVVFRRESLTYRELLEGARRMGAFLAANGIKAGDRVMFSAVSKPETLVIYLGCQWIGAVSVFADKYGTDENLAALVKECEASIFLAGKLPKTDMGDAKVTLIKEAVEASKEMAETSRYTPNASECSEMIFTTGTTGRPKGVMLSFGAVASIIEHTIAGIGISESDRTLVPLPLHHSFSLRVVRSLLASGATVVLQNGLAMAREVEINQTEHFCDSMIAVPVSMELLRDQMKERFYEIMGRFDRIEVGAGSLTTEQRKRLAEKLPDTRIMNTWGSSETGGALFINVSETAKDPVLVSALGKPLPDIEVEVVDSDGAVIEGTGPDHVGRLVLGGGMIMSGYYGRPELNAETLVDGKLRTNDLVYLDDFGYLHMLGRADDIINVGGEKVSPIEVENIASEFPDLRECACVGVPDPEGKMGQVPVLFYAADKDIAETEFRKYLAPLMEKYKMPSYYVRVEAVPRNKMQKIDRKAVRELWDRR